MQVLIEVWNQLPGAKPVRKFTDRTFNPLASLQSIEKFGSPAWIRTKVHGTMLFVGALPSSESHPAARHSRRFRESAN
jgi:hypothetical protein